MPYTPGPVEIAFKVRKETLAALKHIEKTLKDEEWRLGWFRTTLSKNMNLYNEELSALALVEEFYHQNLLMRMVFGKEYRERLEKMEELTMERKRIEEGLAKQVQIYKDTKTCYEKLAMVHSKACEDFERAIADLPNAK